MGSAQSTRKLTIANSEELGVIHISNGVAQRLAHGVANSTTESASENSAGHDGGHWETSAPAEHKISESVGRSAGAYNGDPINRQPEYTISALKMQQQKEEELNNQNLYWQRRMENMKDNHATIDRILEEEYKRAVDQVASVQGKKKVDPNSAVPPCLDNKDKVLRCYQENPRETLKCSSLVEEFSNCVDQRRAGLIAARC